MTSQLFDAYGRVHTLPGLYEEFPQHFTLTHTSRVGLTTVLPIREPGGWAGKIKFTLERDADWHGVNSEYTDPQTPLSFDGYSGRDWIEGILRDEGEDATVTLKQGVVVGGVFDKKFGYPTGGTFIAEYEGRLNFGTYQRVKRKVQVSLERASLQQTVRARWETKLNLFDYITLDNRIIRPAIPISVPLLPQGITERFASAVTTTKVSTQTFSGDTNGHVWIQFDTSKPTINEIEELASGRVLGTEEGEGPIANEQYLFKFRSSGIRRVEIDLNYRMWVGIKKRTIQLGNSYMTGWTLESSIVLKHLDGTTTVYPVAPTQKTGKAGGVNNYRQTAFSTLVRGKLDVSLDTRAGDRLFWFDKFAMTHDARELGSVQVEITAFTQSIKVSGRTSNVPTATKAVPVYEALRAGIGLITNFSDRLRSKFYGLMGDRYPVDGCGARKVITNGFQIRQFDPESHPPVLSPREILLSLQAVDNIGIQFTTEVQPDDTIIDVLEVEPAARYYNSVELLRIDAVADYREEAIAERLYSNIEVGYEKFVSEGTGALDECFNRHQATTPLKNESAKGEFISPILASSLAIELTRREQFATSPKDGTPYDDNGFFIQCKRDPGFVGQASIATGFGGNVIQVAKAIPFLTVGARVYLSGSNYNDGLFTVTFISDAAKTPWSFYVAEGVVVENVATLTIQAAGVLAINPTAPVNLIPETGQDFDLVAGVDIDTYNLRLTPTRNLLNHAPFWAGCLIGQPNTAAVRKTSVPQNSNVQTRSVADGCDTGRTIGENRAIPVDELLLTALLRPRRVRCRARLSHDQIQRLRIGHAGLLSPEADENGDLQDVNYGYITVPDEGGIPVSGWLEKADWLPGNESVVLSIIRTAVDLGDTQGQNCSQFVGWTIEQAEQADLITRLRLELCRFFDVDVL